MYELKVYKITYGPVPSNMYVPSTRLYLKEEKDLLCDYLFEPEDHEKVLGIFRWVQANVKSNWNLYAKMWLRKGVNYGAMFVLEIESPKEAMHAKLRYGGDYE